MLLRLLSRLDSGAGGGEGDILLSMAIGDPPAPARAGIVLVERQGERVGVRG